MQFLYNILIHCYGLAIRLAALFDPKARLWVTGRRKLFDKLDQAFNLQGTGSKVAWFHCASLGEFEQGRPVLEAFRKKHPSWKIVLTFFSPSGYEIRKNYEGADRVFYLPLDTRRNARLFIEKVRPDMVFFVKYEYWFNYISQLKHRNIPLFVISGIFRREQYFFRWYGGWGRRQLKKISHFFVQDEASARLLGSIGISDLTVSGDTRFDRVAAIAENVREFPPVERFSAGNRLILAGSTWPADEELVFGLVRQGFEKVKYIIAPHETDAAHIEQIRHKLGGIPSQLFSAINEERLDDTTVLIIDGIGFLAHLYQYAMVAYIGGGFGAGIHNILEAVTFGKPVIFGPNYGKFREARDLVKEEGGFTIEGEAELEQILNTLLNDKEAYERASQVCRRYIKFNQGASTIILNEVEKLARL